MTDSASSDFLTHLQEVGAARAKRWHPTPAQEFTGLEWAGAMCGEAGEAANVAKKLRRAELALAGNDRSERPAPQSELIDKLGRELADTLIYMVNVASHYGINLAAVTVEAFNTKSIELGFPERISRVSPPTGSDEELNTRDIARWIDQRGYESIGSGHVTLYDYETEPGIRFDGEMLTSDDPLADACAWADKFMREVPSPDDEGSDESARVCEEWLDKNGYTAPKGFAAESRATAASQAALQPGDLGEGTDEEFADLTRNSP